MRSADPDCPLDFTLSNSGEVYLLHAEHPDALGHLTRNLRGAVTWYCGDVVVEHRYALPLALDLQQDGWTVRLEG